MTGAVLSGKWMSQQWINWLVPAQESVGSSEAIRRRGGGGGTLIEMRTASPPGIVRTVALDFAGRARQRPACRCSIARRALLRSLACAGVSAALPWVSGAGAARGAVPLARGAAPPAHVGVRPDAHSVLIIVDVQNCFIGGGTLAVPHAEDVVPVINRLAAAFANVVVTQDWHTPGHVSFASSHPGRKPYETIELAYGSQVLWPDHCVMGTADAELVKGLDTAKAELVIRKGFHQDLDSYSAFEEADHRTATGLGGYLRERRIRHVFICGLATDFCVAWTAIDARHAGFDTSVIEDACRAIDLNGSLAAAWTSMAAAGVKRIHAADLGI